MPYNNNRDENRNLSLDEIEAREQEEKRRAKREKRKFNVFNSAYTDGRGVDKDEVQIADNPNLANFFRLVGRKLNQLLTTNLMMVAGNFPIFFFFLSMSGYFSDHTTTPYYLVFAPLRGAMLHDQSAATSALGTIFGRQMSVTLPTTVDYVLLALAALVLLTFGPVRCGITYLLRNMFRGKPILMKDDFFETIRRNLRQSILYGILDIAIIGILIYDIIFFNLNLGLHFASDMMFYMTLWMTLLYFFMRPYIYLMIVTFDLSLFKIFKNALRFTVLGIKRNFMMLLGTAVLAGLEYVLMFAFFPLAVIVPFVILPSLLILMGVYAAYPVLKKWLIDPWYEEIPSASVNDGE